MAKQILIVEDEVEVAEALSEVLELAGYSTRIARNGRQAIEHLAQGGRPDLILLDMAMPVLDGRGFRREQLLLGDAAKVPTVVLTADGDARRKAASMNAQGYLSKPCSIKVLLDEVERLI